MKSKFLRNVCILCAIIFLIGMLTAAAIAEDSQQINADKEMAIGQTAELHLEKDVPFAVKISVPESQKLHITAKGLNVKLTVYKGATTQNKTADFASSQHALEKDWDAASGSYMFVFSAAETGSLNFSVNPVEAAAAPADETLPDDEEDLIIEIVLEDETLFFESNVLDPEPAAKPEKPQEAPAEEKETTPAEAAAPAAQPEPEKKSEPEKPQEAPAEKKATTPAEAAAPAAQPEPEKDPEPEKAFLTEDELKEAGYQLATVINLEDAALYENMNDAVPANEMWCGMMVWVKPVDETWGLVQMDPAEEEILSGYMLLEDLAMYLTDTPEEELPKVMRAIFVSSTLDDLPFVSSGTDIELKAELYGFRDTDRYTVQWQYSPDGGETVFDAEDANELTYHYQVNKENFGYSWRLVLTLLPSEEPAEAAL